MKVVMASNNAHKIAELRAILSAYGLDVVSQREAGVHVEPEETGTTFEENSRIKAVAVMQACGLPAVADDSGLMVDALNGEPGVYSARYGGPDCITDSDRINYLLKKLENVPEGKRTAKFVSVITLVTPDGKEIVARGECPGHILFERHGTGGFGYDPVFFAEDAGCTFAELAPEQKNQVSHRARALRAFVEKAFGTKKGEGIMLTSKQRADLRAQANDLDTTLMVGKGGVTENVLSEAARQLEARELVKGRVLEAALLSAREVCDALCEALGADGVQCVGSKFVIYRRSEKKAQEAARQARELKKRKSNPVRRGAQERRRQAREERERRNEYFRQAAIQTAIERRKSREE